MLWLRHSSNIAFAVLFTLNNHSLAQGAEPEAAIAPINDISPSHITWQNPPNCPTPDAQLSALVDTSETHPLWGTVTVTQDGAVWRAQLTIHDAPSRVPSPAIVPSTLHRSIEGATCAEVTEAALLVLSLLQREREEPVVTPASESPVDEQSTGPHLEASAIEPQEQQSSTNALQQERQETSSSVVANAAPESSKGPTPTVTVGAALAGGLWNVNTPSVGAVLSAGYHRGWLGVKAHAGWLTSGEALPTRESARVHLSAYEAGLRLCATFISGLSACAGPTLQHLQVEGRQVEAPTRSAAWFPGFSAALHGALEREGLGVWGELGVNTRLRRIALEVAPRGEVAALERATWYAWVGPQWRWR